MGSLFIPLPQDLCSPGGLTLLLKGMKDFHPDCLIESVWQGIEYLLRQGMGNGEMSLEIIPVSQDTLDDLMTHLIEHLPSLILVDLPLDNSPRSLGLLEKIALFSETLLVPTLCWITPQFFYLIRGR